MADINHSDAVQVTAEVRTHPALQKIARALISLVRWQQEKNNDESEGAATAPTSDDPAAVGEEDCHE